MLIKISLVILFYVITNNSNITIPIPVNSNFTHEKLGGLSKNGFPQLEDKKRCNFQSQISWFPNLSLCNGVTNQKDLESLWLDYAQNTEIYIVYIYICFFYFTINTMFILWLCQNSY